MGAIDIEKIHPLETGLFRYKFRRDRRPGIPIEPSWKFYPKYAVESVGRWPMGRALLQACGPFMCRIKLTRRSWNTWIWP